jgi:subtilisin family serine protease
VSPWHDDLGIDRIVHFADFVDSRSALYDDYGHGTHVAGIIAGSGPRSDGGRRGIAPGADLIVLKALDGDGNGYISNVIAALDYAIAHRDTYSIRIINLSVSAGVYESYHEDPLTLAARRAVDAGIVVVAAAGNLGRDVRGEVQYGGIAAPGNAPWVLTVGASSHNATLNRSDDEVAAFSSRGPAAIDRTAKPDLVAPGVAIRSLAEPSSALFTTRRERALDSGSPPYLSLSGTSMAAPVVAATVALMLEANPSLTPNAVKGILQFTAEAHPDYDHRTQGAGFLNARGAVQLARAFGEPGGAAAAQPHRADPVAWSGQILWSEAPVSGGVLTADANAWKPGVLWGAGATPAGDPIVWGTLCAPGDATCRGPAWTLACDQGAPGCAAGKAAGEARREKPTGNQRIH